MKNRLKSSLSITVRKSTTLAIYGAGGFAREVAWLLSALPAYEVFAYIEDDAVGGRLLKGKPVLTLEQACSRVSQTPGTVIPELKIIVAVGNSVVRAKLVERCRQLGLRFATLQHPSVQISEYVKVGTGSILCCGSILTVDIEIGEHVHINLDCTVGHDVVMEDFVTLAPGVHVSGHVFIGRGAYIGTGATIINGTAAQPIVIGAGCVIAAGACVTTSTAANTLYAGVPAVWKKSF